MHRARLGAYVLGRQLTRPPVKPSTNAFGVRDQRLDVRRSGRSGRAECTVMYRGSAGIETGWAAGRGDQPLAAALGQQNKHGDPGSWTSAAGLSFDRLLVSTGTQSGIPQGTAVHGRMPDGYP